MQSAEKSSVRTDASLQLAQQSKSIAPCGRRAANPVFLTFVVRYGFVKKIRRYHGRKFATSVRGTAANRMFRG